MERKSTNTDEKRLTLKISEDVAGLKAEVVFGFLFDLALDLNRYRNSGNTEHCDSWVRLTSEHVNQR